MVIKDDHGWLTVGAAARWLGVSPATLRRWDRAGHLAAQRHPINGYRVYDRSSLERRRQALPVAAGAAQRVCRQLHGREPELERLARAARAAGTTWTSVVGPIGIGKTRLLRELLRDQRAIACELGAARDARDVLARIDAALALATDRKRTQLLLDPFDDWASLADEIRRRAHGVSVFCARCGPLARSWERVIRLAPLELPERDADSRFVLGAAATSALLEAAEVSGPTLSEPAVRALGRIVRATDGVPWSIEHVARLASVVPFQKLAEWLDSGAIEPLSNQHAARIARGWSRLSPVERELLLDLCAFSGSFSLRTAAALRGVSEAAGA
jgi:DNA-binding transcriptional MerR regulator